jgi:membrane protease YdiL (CAAX protease family)
LLAFGYRSRLVPEIPLQALPLLPTVLLFAALNALYEEVVYKAAPLSQLEPNFGKHPALWLTALMFGLGHFTESYFLPGMSIVLPAFLGYMMSKSILETRGLVWAWIIHFGLDVVIFSFLAFAAVS